MGEGLPLQVQVALLLAPVLLLLLVFLLHHLPAPLLLLLLAFLLLHLPPPLLLLQLLHQLLLVVLAGVVAGVPAPEPTPPLSCPGLQDSRCAHIAPQRSLTNQLQTCASMEEVVWQQQHDQQDIVIAVCR
jgi:predicted membrane metal-binding protein